MIFHALSGNILVGRLERGLTQPLIRYYGETATIVLEDNKICELSFQKEHEARRIVVDDTVTTFHQVVNHSNKHQSLTKRISGGF